jgi:ribonuclease Z
MKLVLLGTTGYHPNDERQTACFMLPELGIVLDAGTGMYRVRDELVTKHLDIFLTHSHLDHIVGLTFLFDVTYGKSVERVTVYGEAEKLAAVREHLFTESVFPVGPPFEFHPLDGDVALAGGGRLSYFPLDHPGGSVGFRLEWPGHSLAYVTDTIARPNADYLEQIRGVDLLLHECYFTDDLSAQAELTGHSWTTRVAEVARAAAVKRLVLVHINPLATGADPVGLAGARAIFPPTEIGYDRMVVEF